jgi:hypothetical protein
MRSRRATVGNRAVISKAAGVLFAPGPDDVFCLLAIDADCSGPTEMMPGFSKDSS